MDVTPPLVHRHGAPYRACAQFRPIAEVETTPVNGVIDIIGVVESVGDYMDITLKNGSATHKRSVQLKDQSNASVEVRLL